MKILNREPEKERIAAKCEHTESCKQFEKIEQQNFKKIQPLEEHVQWAKIYNQMEGLE